MQFAAHNLDAAAVSCWLRRLAVVPPCRQATSGKSGCAHRVEAVFPVPRPRVGTATLAPNPPPKSRPGGVSHMTRPYWRCPVRYRFRRSLRLEALEGRWLPATGAYMQTNLVADQAGVAAQQ